jgi:hypothetical protein
VQTLRLPAPPAEKKRKECEDGPSLIAMVAEKQGTGNREQGLGTGD